MPDTQAPSFAAANVYGLRICSRYCRAANREQRRLWRSGHRLLSWMRQVKLGIIGTAVMVHLPTSHHCFPHLRRPSMIGPETLFSQRLHTEKYRQPGESFDDYCVRYARTTADTPKHFRQLLGALRAQRTLPAGRQQLAVGNPYQTTAANCYVGGNIPDSMAGIMEELGNSAMTLRSGGGCGWNFGTLRPEHEPIRGLGPGAVASGPVAFMGLWHAMCGTIMSAGMRRGAMMGVLPVSHPDIMKFIRAKRVSGALTNFNVSVGITNAFMEAVHADGLFPLTFADREFARVRALDVWAAMMENTWDWAEPGVLFIDRINEMNPLGFCEKIVATNPCIPAGSLVSTPRGLIPVEQVAEGDEITTVAGSGLVKGVEIYQEQEVLEVILSDGARIEATPGHIFHTCRGETKRWDVETRLKDILVGDKVRLAPGQCPDNPLPRRLLGLADRDAGFLVGIVMGDGCYTEATPQVKIAVGHHEKSWRAELCSFFDRVGITYSVYDKPTETCCQITLPKAVKTALSEFGFPVGYSNEKALPLSLINTNSDFLAGFIDGYISTDGNIHTAHANPQVRISTSSYESALSLRRVFHLLGMHARTYSIKRDRHFLAGREMRSNPAWQVVLMGTNIAELARQVSITHPEKAARLRLMQTQYRLSGETWAATIKSIKPIGRKRVYDLFEPSTDTWITEGMVSRGCGEQPLPPHGACFLLSQNVVKYLVPSHRRDGSNYEIDLDLFAHDVRASVRAVDKVIDNTVYPLPQQKAEAFAKRRIGIGVTGMANALEVCGLVYGTPSYIAAQERILTVLRDTAYDESCGVGPRAAAGTFPLFDADGWLASGFAKTLPQTTSATRSGRCGLRNGLLLSIASHGDYLPVRRQLCPGGIEKPVFVHQQTRLVNMPEGQITVDLGDDWAFVNHGVRGRCANDVSPTEHVAVLCSAQKYIDSAVSKTINVRGAVAGNVKPGEITFDEFKGVYLQAWEGGAKGCTTFNANGKRFGILAERAESTESAACTIDPETGKKSCGD